MLEELYKSYGYACMGPLTAATVFSGNCVVVVRLLCSPNVWIPPQHQDKQTLALRELNASLAVDQRVDFSLVAVGDGIALCRRLQ